MQTTRLPGRPATAPEIRRLTLRLASEDPTGAWTTQAARNLFLRNADRLTGSQALGRDLGSQFIEPPWV